MSGSLSPGAFEFYLGLGHRRSFRAVALHFRASRRAVARLAREEHWRVRVEAHERAAVEALERACVEREVERRLEPLNVRTERLARKLDMVSRFRPQSPADALHLVRVGSTIVRQGTLCAVEANESLVDDLLLRMYARGQLTRRELRAAFKERGDAA